MSTEVQNTTSSQHDAKLPVSRSCFDCGNTYKTFDVENKFHLCPYCEDEYEREDEDDYRERMEEQRLEELAERASFCKCGAWQFAKDGSVVHVADCCCGAE